MKRYRELRYQRDPTSLRSRREKKTAKHRVRSRIAVMGKGRRGSWGGYGELPHERGTIERRSPRGNNEPKP